MNLNSLYAFDLAKISDIELHIKKFSKSAISYQGEVRSFEWVLRNVTSDVFAERLSEFKRRLDFLDMSCLDEVADAWPIYIPYTNFVRKFMERQVTWFETQV